jgi:putative N6-adenine-specific DNA methylase
MLGTRRGTGVRMVSFKGIKDLCTKLICHCIKILKPIFLKATNEQALYKGYNCVNWSRYINANQTFVIDATDNFNHSEFVHKNVRMQ